MGKNFVASMNFATVSDVMIDLFNQYLAAQNEISVIESEYADKITEAEEAVKAAQAVLDKLTPVKDTDPYTWGNARDNVTIAVNRVNALNKAKTNELKQPRKTARVAGKAIAPDTLYNAYKACVEAGKTAEYSVAISDWLFGMGFTRRSKDKSGKLWSCAIADIMVASGVKSRDMELKASSTTVWRKNIICMILTRGICMSAAWDFNEDLRIVKHVF